MQPALDNIFNKRGLVLVELIVAVTIIGLLAMLAFMNVSGLVGKSQFEEKAQRLINIMQMVCESAAKSEIKYEILFDPAEGYYQVREMTISDVNSADPENIIETGKFTEDFDLAYVEFDDAEFTEQEAAIFRVGIAGYQYGGKIVILDEDGNPYSIVVSRINCRVELLEDDVDLLVPKDKDDLPF